MTFDPELAREWEKVTKECMELLVIKRKPKPLSHFYWRLANSNNKGGGWPERSDHE